MNTKLTLDQFNTWLFNSGIPATAKPGNDCVWIHQTDQTMSRAALMSRLGRIGTVTDVGCEDFTLRSERVETQEYRPFAL